MESIASEAESEDEFISMEMASLRLQEAEARLTALREESNQLRERGPWKQKDLKRLKADIKSVKAEAKHACIKYRNDYARPTMQRQFAEGIRE